MSESVTLKWDSVRWPDGATYEGLTRDGQCHGSGVLTLRDKSRYSNLWKSLPNSSDCQSLIHKFTEQQKGTLCMSYIHH